MNIWIFNFLFVFILIEISRSKSVSVLAQNIKLYATYEHLSAIKTLTVYSVDINILSKTLQEKCNDNAYIALKSYILYSYRVP